MECCTDVFDSTKSPKRNNLVSLLIPKRIDLKCTLKHEFQKRKNLAKQNLILKWKYCTIYQTYTSKIANLKWKKTARQIILWIESLNDYLVFLALKKGGYLKTLCSKIDNNKV